MASIGSRLAVGADNSLVAVPMENAFTNQGAIASKETLYDAIDETEEEWNDENGWSL